jgi:hypothetical protein
VRQSVPGGPAPVVEPPPLLLPPELPVVTSLGRQWPLTQLAAPAQHWALEVHTLPSHAGRPVVPELPAPGMQNPSVQTVPEQHAAPPAQDRPMQLPPLEPLAAPEDPPELPVGPLQTPERQACPGPQKAQTLPLIPQLAVSEGWQVPLAEQQPSGHVVASHLPQPEPATAMPIAAATANNLFMDGLPNNDWSLGSPRESRLRGPGCYTTTNLGRR